MKCLRGKLSDQISALYTKTLGYRCPIAKSHHLPRNSLSTECFDLSKGQFCVALCGKWEPLRKSSEVGDFFFLHTLTHQPFRPGLINSADTFSNLLLPLLHYRFTKRLCGQGDRRQKEMMMTGTKRTEAGRTSAQVLFLPVNLCRGHCVCVCVCVCD